jgi:putative membrane-bound dehydrogenase-like protein
LPQPAFPSPPTEILLSMKALTFGLSVATVFAMTICARAQLPPEKAERTFTVSDGLEFKLWASEPLFVNPTCMDIDHKGRVWVCESVNYRDTLHRRPLRRAAGDRIVILEDTKGAGRADKAITFYQSRELLAPLGIAVAKDPVGPGYKVYVCQSPNILLFEDKDGDGKADGPPRKLLTGFRGVDHDHGVHGILIGPDCKLYFSVGDQGVENLQSSDGKGRKWTTNHTDCQAGTIWRCDMDGKNLELIAHNFRNEYEPCVDSFGNIFVSDNDDDGNQQTRICFVMPGGNYGYWPRGPHESHWHEEQPGVVPKILRTYFGSPTGMCVYEGTLLPKKYWGQLLHTDAGPRHVRCYHLTPKGAGYDVDREDMVTSTDTWFRPSDICVAPDGSAFVSDWYDQGVGGHGMSDTTRGRIYRLAPAGHRTYRVPEVNLHQKDGVVRALTSPNLATRYMAMALLQRMKLEDALEILLPAGSQKEDDILKARSLWQLGRLLDITSGPAVEKRAWASSDPRFRILAIRILKDFYVSGYVFLSRWRTELLDQSCMPVCREAILALQDSDLPAPARGKLVHGPNKMKKERDLIVNLAKKYDGNDRFYLEAIGIAVGKDGKRRESILADFDKEFPEWNQKVANLIWELRPPKVMSRLEIRLFDAATPADERRQIVEILATSDDVNEGKVLLKALEHSPPQALRERIIESLKQALPGRWRDLRNSTEFSEVVQALSAKDETVVQALDLVAAAGKVDALGTVSGIASDKQRTIGTRMAAIRTLGALRTPDAAKALEELVTAEPASLRVEAVQALGSHVDKQQRRNTDAPAFKSLVRVVNSSAYDPSVRQAAGVALAESRAGGLWLLDANKKKALPDVVRPAVARLLRNSPYKDVHDRAVIDFPAPRKLDPKKLPSPAQLATRKGDANRGRELLAASLKNDMQCLKCHTIHGIGGKVGPDLSVIGAKASRENLFESILNPSKAVADQYVSWVVETKKGAILTGLLVEETPDAITIRDANAKDTKVEKKDIETKSKGLTSLMPVDLVAYMTEDDLVDIVEYLLSLK